METVAEAHTKFKFCFLELSGTIFFPQIFPPEIGLNHVCGICGHRKPIVPF